ncbi:phosphoenolpyruvate-protein phosphotransferase [Dermabacter vaginalis]|uniref:Phosphoenolpyruvate-protein phosphotransferase n=1 Tax=Dermabacter vaginalis TaxID=1630135 RepID=A0A1B0ZFP8_9MICO|nr:phosphoenolpyruvate--protein phosphotransferase [Dermabacter vaginalis]ANP26752.1 phosphoenolpyruvate-protein phosphotransferase [Dermabacter vaginalis]
MTTYRGVAVSAGRVIDPVKVMAPPVSEPERGAAIAEGEPRELEASRITEAAAAVKADLEARAARASGDGKAVLEATAQMAADPTLTTSAEQLVRGQGLSAERAVWEAGDQVSAMLESLGGYMAERASDVKDVRARIVAQLRGVEAPGIPVSKERFVLVAHDLAPADTAMLDPNIVSALVTVDGGPQSHTAILARQLGIPAVVAAKGVDEIEPGTVVYVDGAAGIVTSEFGERERELSAAWCELVKNPLTYSGGGAELSDGTRVPLLANVGGEKDAAFAAEANADGVGLFRTEFCFLDRDEEPSIDEQAEAYAGVLREFPGKKVVIRTLDAGADKPLPFLTDAEEPNPALGVRAYRTSWEKRSVLENQLKAIAQASAMTDAEPWVMAPMISTLEDTEDFVSMARSAGVECAGIMVETPSAALTSDHLMTVADFASIGTNDLTQYTMAADRMLGSLAKLNDPWQPAVLALVGATASGARLAGGDPEAFGDGANKPVGVCGEAAGDPALAVVLVGLGVNSLSMTPRSLPAVAKVLSTVSLDQARELARLAVSAPTAAEGKQTVRAKLPIIDELGL